MTGYIGFSMSRNMAAAQAAGELPASKAAKALGVSTAAIKAVLTPCAWHHASSHYNRVDVYDINGLLALKRGEEVPAGYDPDDESEAWEALRAFKAEPIARNSFRGNAYWIEWSGSRAHPKAEHRQALGIEIEQAGSFWIFHTDEGPVRKKFGSNGTRVDSLAELEQAELWTQIRQAMDKMLAAARPAWEQYSETLASPRPADFGRYYLDLNRDYSAAYIWPFKPTSAEKREGLRRVQITEAGIANGVCRGYIQEWDGREWCRVPGFEDFEFSVDGEKALSVAYFVADRERYAALDRALVCNDSAQMRAALTTAGTVAGNGNN